MPTTSAPQIPPQVAPAYPDASLPGLPEELRRMICTELCKLSRPVHYPIDTTFRQRRDVTKPFLLQPAARANKQLWHDYCFVATRDALPVHDRIIYNAALYDKTTLWHRGALTVPEAILNVELTIPTWLEDQDSDEYYGGDGDPRNEPEWEADGRGFSLTKEKLSQFVHGFDFTRNLVTLAVEMDLKAVAHDLPYYIPEIYSDRIFPDNSAEMGKRVVKAVYRYLTGEREGAALLEVSVRVHKRYGLHARRDTVQSAWVKSGRLMQCEDRKVVIKPGAERSVQKRAWQDFLTRWQL